LKEEDEALAKLLELSGVSMEYPSTGLVLEEIYFSVSIQDFVVIRGRSGIGKSSLLRIAGLLDAPTRGRVYLEGHDSSSMDDGVLSRIRLKDIGFVPQQFNLIGALTSLENVELPMQIAGRRKREERRTRAEELLKSLGMQDHVRKYPGQLSVGQQQRVAVARALANDPRLILADEPTSNLDEESASLVLGCLLNRAEKSAIILTTTSAEEKFPSTSEYKLTDGGRLVRI